MRFPAAAAVLTAGVAMLSACDAGRRFEEACATRLAPATVEVLTEPVRYATDLSQSVFDLTRRQSSPWGREVTGLVAADLRSEVTVGARGLADRSGGRYCIRPDVTVRLAFSPMTMFIAREQAPGSCAHRLTLDHELKHVRVYEDYLADVRDEIRRRLLEDLGDRPLVFASEREADAGVRRLLEERLAPFVHEAMREVLDLQKLVDSEAEYARLDREQARCVLAEPRAQARAD